MAFDFSCDGCKWAYRRCVNQYEVIEPIITVTDSRTGRVHEFPDNTSGDRVAKIFKKNGQTITQKEFRKAKDRGWYPGTADMPSRTPAQELGNNSTSGLLYARQGIKREFHQLKFPFHKLPECAQPVCPRLLCAATAIATLGLLAVSGAVAFIYVYE